MRIRMLGALVAAMAMSLAVTPATAARIVSYNVLNGSFTELSGNNASVCGHPFTYKGTVTVVPREGSGYCGASFRTSRMAVER